MSSLIIPPPEIWIKKRPNLVRAYVDINGTTNNVYTIDNMYFPTLHLEVPGNTDAVQMKALITPIGEATKNRNALIADNRSFTMTGDGPGAAGSSEQSNPGTVYIPGPCKVHITRRVLIAQAPSRLIAIWHTWSN